MPATSAAMTQSVWLPAARYAATRSPARRSAAISSLFMRISAVITRFPRAASPPPMSSIICVGTTCHDRPYLSLSQPHTCALGSPPGVSLSQ